MIAGLGAKCALLLAGEWISLLFFLIPLVLWALNQLFSNSADDRARRAAAQRRRAPPPPPPQQQGADDEVSEFLKRAARRRAESAGNPPAATPPRQPGRQRPAATPPRPAAEPPRRLAKSLREKADVVETELVAAEPRSRSVSDSVREHLDTSRFAERTRRLADTEADAEELTAHVQQVFDHQIGSLARTSVSDDAAAAGAAKAAAAAARPAVVELLRNPQSVVNAFLLGEILRRPEERW